MPSIRKPENNLHWKSLPERCLRPTIIEGQQQLHGARIADSDTDAIAAEYALLRASLGSVDVRQIFVRHLMRTPTVLDTILPGLTSFQSRVPLKYIAKTCE